MIHLNETSYRRRRLNVKILCGLNTIERIFFNELFSDTPKRVLNAGAASHEQGCPLE